MIKNKRNNLVSIICNDLIKQDKLALFLFGLVLISASLVIIITYQTRCLIVHHEQLLLEQNALDTEWRNLILEENVLGDHSRIEQLANKKFNMHYVDPLQENIILIQTTSIPQ